MSLELGLDGCRRVQQERWRLQARRKNKKEATGEGTRYSAVMFTRGRPGIAANKEEEEEEMMILDRLNITDVSYRKCHDANFILLLLLKATLLIKYRLFCLPSAQVQNRASDFTYSLDHTYLLL